MNERPGASAEDSTIHTLNRSLPLIRASELTQYSFCHRAWWLGTVKGLSPRDRTTLTRGRQMHIRHRRQVQAVSRWRWAGLGLLGSGSLLLLAVFLWLWLY